MPGARRLLAELAAHEIPTALVSASHRRIIDAMLRSLGPEHFALYRRRRRGGAHQAAPRPVSDRRRRARRGPGALRGRSRTPSPGSPPPRRPAAGWSRCRRSAPIAPAPGRTVVASLEEVDLPFLRALMTQVH